ncbi:MAG: hypothetical protein J6Y07_00620 [Alphaproteobacteria bacterium]|nr:hypothetical protein [Alphaproteobacteria bacterium]
MFNKKTKLIIAITTYDVDALRISVPPLRRCARDATLVIHNDNPKIELSRQFVRELGWRGALYIINEKNTVGEFESRINVLEYIEKEKILCDWIVFVDDDDALIDATIPNVSETTFAIIQNAVTISESITDLFKITPKWVNGSEYGKTGTHFDITGTLIRYKVAVKFAHFMRSVLPEVMKIEHSFKYRISVGAVMWAGLSVFMRITNPEMSAIYMNRTNYVSIKLGCAQQKYGMRTVPATSAKTFNSNVIKKYTQMFESYVLQNMVADAQ